MRSRYQDIPHLGNILAERVSSYKLHLVKRKDLAGTVVLLTRLSRSVYRHVDDKQLGMSFKEFTALAAVRETDGRGQKELGEALLLEANAMTQLINQLEE